METRTAPTIQMRANVSHFHALLGSLPVSPAKTNVFSGEIDNFIFLDFLLQISFTGLSLLNLKGNMYVTVLRWDRLEWLQGKKSK